MESALRFFRTTVVLIAGLTSSSVLGALRSKMSGVVSDASDVTWAHAVNSWDALEKALEGPIDFLEADISLGHVVGKEGPLPVPIMAHPPDETSDISLDTWISTVVTKRPDKGVKLDFKSLEVLEPSLIILQKYASKLNSSVWLNADVLSGPVYSPTTPVQFEQFLSLCQEYFPNATLSTGWTTNWFATITKESWQYGWQHVRNMADVIRCRGYKSNHAKFTFPVRGIFASRSIQQLQWLLNTIPSSTLTVWTGRHDPLQVDDLLRIRQSFGIDKVYYDVPETIYTAFQENKNSIDGPSHNAMANDGQWMILTKDQGASCSALTYVKSDAIVFGKSVTTTVLQKNLILLGEKDNLRVTGRVKFFNIQEQRDLYLREGMQELSIVLADVSLFSKTSSDRSEKELDLTTSDTKVIWSAINASLIYTFKHKYAQEDSSCRLFKLDTSEDKSFEVWTVPCDVMTEENTFEEVSENGIAEISSRKRLVLPKGPFMLGFMSAGDEHVVIYDLKITGHKEAFASGSNTIKSSLRLLTVSILLLFILCTFF